jgi:REP element-mobilizing transposase RayT
MFQMPTARKNIISLDATPYYHVTARCVRRAFLCGFDTVSGNSYGHRRQWIEDRILELSQIFAIEICAFAVMSNHFHIVLHIDKPSSCHWTNLEVCQRWHQLCKGTFLTQRFERGDPLTTAELDAVMLKLDEWRLRLCNVSWFMKLLNEPIAREANREDQCSGKFWESRFKSQALLDEKALAACMAYVDLNPIRAKMADTPENSDHTSVQQRIRSHLKNTQPNTLMPFAGNPREPMPKGLPFRPQDYLELVDSTGRTIRGDKRGSINEYLPPILERLAIEPKHWLYMTNHFESRFKSMVGGWYELKKVYRNLGYQRTPGLKSCKQLL